MTGHAINVYLTADPAASIAMVCLEPPEAACRLTCPNRCEQVVVCGTGPYLCDEEHPAGLHCGLCGALLEPLEPGDCHVANWLDDVIEGYDGPTRTFRIPVDIDWYEDGATWSLPEKPTLSEVTR